MNISNITKLITTMLAVMLLAVSCVESDKVFEDFENSVGSGGQVEATGVGYVSFSNLALNVDVENENFSDSASDSGTKTRTEGNEVDTDPTSDYLVIITDAEDKEIYNETYATAIASDNLELAAGKYSLLVTSNDNIPAVAWGTKEYSSEVQSLTVGNDNVTQIGTVTCRLATIKTQISIAADMLAQFNTESVDDPFLVTLTYGTAELVYTVDKLYSSEDSDEQADAKSGYFAPQDGVEDMTITITGLYDVSSVYDEEPIYTPITWEESITDVSSSQSRMITVQIDNFENGNIEIGFEVQEWVYDTPLGVDIFSTKFAVIMQETEIFEPDPSNGSSDEGSAVLTRTDGEENDTPYIITNETFDETWKTYSPLYGIVLTPEDEATIKSIMIYVSSENSSFISALETAGYSDKCLYIWSDGAATTDFSSYLGTSEDASTHAITVGLHYNAIKAIYEYIGEHTFTVVATDSNGRKSTTPLYFEALSPLELVNPTISGISGEELTISTNEADNPEIKFSIHSPNGIDTLALSIISNVLTEEALEVLCLSQDMDLTYPATDEMAGALSNLDFPVGSEVIGETDLEFDITSFMTLLAELHISYKPDIEEGRTSFVIRAVDASGGESTETLSVVSYYYKEE